MFTRVGEPSRHYCERTDHARTTSLGSALLLLLYSETTKKYFYRTYTLAPSLAKLIAAAFPMPDDAPVTRATLPSSLPGMIAELGSSNVLGVTLVLDVTLVRKMYSSTEQVERGREHQW